MSGLGRGGEESRIKIAKTRFTNGPVLKPTTRTEQKIKSSLIKNKLRLSKTSTSKIKNETLFILILGVVFCKIILLTIKINAPVVNYGGRGGR